MKHIHILGICGTFMGGIAVLARQQGYRVTGSDDNVYPPMSTQLEQQGIELMTGFDPSHLEPMPDYVVIGNAMTRGSAAVEYLLNHNIPYSSGPQWLAGHILKNRWVLAVAGTHGKTTTASMLSWILEYAGMSPGFLIGGVPQNFDSSARLGDSDFFVVEADEYDSAFFDKRSKFIHYHPRTLLINNLEFDHADIFDDLAAIQKQFHHLVRTIPGEGLIVHPQQVAAIEQVFQQGCWTPRQSLSVTGEQADWQVRDIAADCSEFDVLFDGQMQATVRWSLLGKHNIANALGAMAAARHVGVPPTIAAEALASFKNVKRRLELKGCVNGVRVYDDFAHHPTAMKTTVEGLRAKVGSNKITAVVELRSFTMKSGYHGPAVMDALQGADEIILLNTAETLLDQLIEHSNKPAYLFDEVSQIVAHLTQSAKTRDEILVMSNGGFGGIYDKLLQALSSC